MMQSFDDRIREGFSDFSPEVPDHIWENIVAKKKKRRPLLWIWLFLVLGGAAVIISTGKSNKNRNELKGQSENISGSIKSPAEGSGKKKGSQTLPLISPSASMESKTPALSGNTGPSGDQVSISAPDEPSGNIVKPDNTEKSRTAGKSSGGFGQAGKAGLSENQIFTFGNKTKPTGKKGRLPEKNQGLMPDSEVSDFYASQSMEETATGKYIAMRRSSRDISFNLFPPRNLRQEIPCPEKDAAGNKKYFEFYAGPDLVFRSFRDTGHSDYLQKRKETTSIAFAFSAGGRFTKVFNNGMSIRTGINYSRIREKFTLAEGNVIQTIFITDANGDTIGNYSTRGTLYRKTFNHYNTIDIPLVIGYEMGNGRLHTNINAGVIANLYSWQQGLVVDTANKAVSITTGSDPSPYQFKTNVGVGFLGSVSFYYKLNERVHVMAEPYFRYNLSAFNKEEITLKQKFHNTGIRLGIRYDLK